MKEIIEIILNIIDIYCQQYFIHFNNKSHHRTTLGIILGLTSIIIFIFLFLFYLIKVYERKTFSIKTESLIESNVYVNLTNIPFGFTLLNKKGEYILYDEKLYTLTIIYYDEINDKIINLPLEYCKDKEFIKDIKNFTNLLCINYKEYLYLQGISASSSKSYIQLVLRKCNSDKSLNYLDNECYDEKIIDEEFENSNFYMYYYENYLKNDDYNNPIKKRINYEIFSLTPYIQKNINYYFEDYNYQSDNGILFPNVVSTDFFKYHDHTFDFNYIEDRSKNPILLKINFQIFETSYVIKRNYLKIQDIIGNLESYINAIYKIILFFYILITKKIIYKDIINFLLLDDKNNNIINKTIIKNKEKNRNLNYSNNDISKKNILITNNDYQNENIILSLYNLNITKKSKYNNKNKRKNNLKKNKNINNILTKLKNINLNLFNKKEKNTINFKYYYYIFPISLFGKKRDLSKYFQMKEYICKNLSAEKILNLSQFYDYYINYICNKKD